MFIPTNVIRHYKLLASTAFPRIQSASFAARSRLDTMDLAYDHIQEEIYVSRDNDEKRDDNAPDSEKTDDQSSERPPLNLSEEFQETFREFSDSAWGTRLGGLWGNFRSHGESYYKEARQEYNAASEEAIKGFTGLKDNLIQHTRGLSLVGANDKGKDAEGEDKLGTDEGEASNTEKERSAPQDGNEEEGEGFIARFKAEAAKRLKEIQKAEDAADEALLKFGTNVRDFLRDAVSVAPPDESSSEGPSDKVMFESKGADGKRVIHTTRFDAQLHAIHTNLESFSKDPVGEEWSKWHNEFQVDKKTDDISNDLEAYPELRKAMEALVPENVEYAGFWNRYYFLRMVIETEEKKRKELLKGMSRCPSFLLLYRDTDIA